MPMELPCLDFVNSEFRFVRGGMEDRLLKPLWVRAFLRRWGWRAPLRPPQAGLRALFRLRRVVRRMIEAAGAGRLPRQSDLDHLNAIMRRAAVAGRLVKGDGAIRLELRAGATGWHRVLAELAASVADLFVTYDPARLRVCDNPSCRYVFYDMTRNKRKRWCSSRVCGNIFKVRWFRARRRRRRPQRATRKMPRPAQ
jgi:predicted RNA-binding Zn ribbon-like protein